MNRGSEVPQCGPRAKLEYGFGAKHIIVCMQDFLKYNNIIMNAQVIKNSGGVHISMDTPHGQKLRLSGHQ